MTLPKRGAAEYRALTRAFDNANPACLNDWRYTVDPDDLDDDEKVTMHNVCRQCPLIDACRIYAATARPSGGFWAGRYWGRKERSS